MSNHNFREIERDGANICCVCERTRDRIEIIMEDHSRMFEFDLDGMPRQLCEEHLAEFVGEAACALYIASGEHRAMLTAIHDQCAREVVGAMTKGIIDGVIGREVAG